LKSEIKPKLPPAFLKPGLLVEEALLLLLLLLFTTAAWPPAVT
jgi:hypothetical protein